MARSLAPVSYGCNHPASSPSHQRHILVIVVMLLGALACNSVLHSYCAWPGHRYGALKSLGEKKQCFNEYIQQRRNDEREEERRKARQAKDDFFKMLMESTELKLSHGFRRAREIFEDDSRWKVGGGLCAGGSQTACCKHPVKLVCQ